MENAYLSKVTDEIKKSIREKIGPDIKLDLFELILDEGEIFEGIFKRPTRAIFERFSSLVGKKDASRASLALVRDLILYPSFEDFSQLIEERPALSIALSSELTKGIGMVEDVKKKAI